MALYGEIDPVFNEYVDYPGVKLGACDPFHLLQDHIVRKPLAVGPVAAHGVVNVRAAYFPGRQGYVAALQALRVAAAVEVLMVGGYYHRDRFHEGYALQYLFPDLGVLFHADAFFVGQGSGLVKDAFVNPDLPEVMEKRGVLERLYLFGGKPHELAEL